MIKYTDKGTARQHLTDRLMECALNNVGIKADADEVFRDIAENRLPVWIDELQTYDVQEVRWIPVTERFPEEEGTYLVTYTDGGVTEVGSSMYLQREDGSEPYWDYFVVIAWMPLPEPYKGGEEE